MTSALAPTVVSGGATVLGALGLYGLRQPTRRTLDTLLGGSAGVMLAAVSFALLVPALEGQGTLGGAALARWPWSPEQRGSGPCTASCPTNTSSRARRGRRLPPPVARPCS